MRRPSGARARARTLLASSVAMLGLLGPAACAGRTGGTAAGASAAGSRGGASDTTLEGAFRWTGVNEQPAPVEFPPGSRVTVVAGTLELRGIAAAARDGGARFGLRFTVRPTSGDSARVTGEDGRFRVAGDSLLFTPDGKESRPPVRFRYAWRPDGALALTDVQGHVWGYVRQ